MADATLFRHIVLQRPTFLSVCRFISGESPFFFFFCQRDITCEQQHLKKSVDLDIEKNF